jgi:two-component system OmpR family sensor kinase/two-component system sensor histidine kinase BaeS
VGVVLDAAQPDSEQRARERSPAPLGRPFLLLADAEGSVIYGDRMGRLSEGQKAGAVPISVDGTTVGFLTSTAPRPAQVLGPLEQSFLARFRASLIVGAAAAGALGLLLGLLLSRSLTAPLRRLTGAAKAVAAGDFSQRVDEAGSAELAEVARSFNEMTAALQQAETLRQNLMADVAHELRTPLTVLQGNLRALLDDVYPLEKAEVAHLYDETRLLGRLVEDLRELALAEAGQLRLDLQPTDAVDVLRSTVSTFSPLAGEKHVTLSLDVDETLPMVVADTDRVVQVLVNLLGNGLRHTPAGGRIAVSARPQGDVVEISVTDTGEGLSPEDLPFVFDRFWRSDRSRARESGGSGLGLAIARQLVQAQGGSIGARSDVGNGSCFWFTLCSASA